MSRRGHHDNDLSALDELSEEITVDAYGEDEQLWAFRQVFDRMLWLNPSDNQGVRFLIEDVRVGEAWEAQRDER
jgi:hypothetical protein